MFALNRSGDPGVNLLVISATSCGLMFLKGLTSRIYKNWLVEAISMTCYLNMALLSISTFFSLENMSNQSTFAFISGSVVILVLFIVLSYHLFTEICLKVWKRLNKQNTNSSLGETTNLPDVSQIDFDSRDYSPMDESMSKFKDHKSDHPELSTLPDCGNSLHKHRGEHKAPLHRNSSSDDVDTDSDRSVIPLLNDY